MKINRRARQAMGCFAILISISCGNTIGLLQAADPPPEIKRTLDGSTISPEGCTIENIHVFSPSMSREIRGIVVLPPEYKDHPEKTYPILYTLHGYDSPIDRYLTKTPALLQALKDKPMIVTCMDVDGESWYLDSPYPQVIGRGDKTTKVTSLFTTFFFDEFIPCLDHNYRINPKQRMLTGTSMGGFGAFHYMLTKPWLFVSVSALSGLYETTTADKKWIPLLGTIEEFPERHKAVDVFEHLKSDVQQGLKFPQIYMVVGTEDPLLPHNRAMEALLTQENIPSEYHEFPGKHGWPFWSEQLPAVIDFHWNSLQKPAPNLTQQK